VTLTEALTIVRDAERRGVPVYPASLACGFNSTHLETFISAAAYQLDSTRRVVFSNGLFGDLLGNIESGASPGREQMVVIIEWGDLDPRLNLRSLGDWSPQGLADILVTAGARSAEIVSRVRAASSQVPVVVVLPTLPLPPVSFAPTWEAASFELELRKHVATLAADVAALPRVRVASAQRLDELSPLDARGDLTADFVSGFPYAVKHASAMGTVIAQSIHAPVPKKGLIIDLDNTLWRGIVGDDGVDAISWNLDGRSQVHGLFQCLVRSLSASGVLVAVASKNDPQVVHDAFDRADMILRRDDVFPFEVGWNPKSESVSRILDAWNIGADAVVFVDDSAMEIAEVQSVHASIEGMLFPQNDVRATYALLRQLRDRFGKRRVTEEDGLRMASLRRAQEREVGTSPSSESFLAQSEAVLTLDFAPAPDDSRPLELVNKTNQFNLNGRRHTELSWRSAVSAPGSVVMVASYSDKFGPLGKIAVLAGRVSDDTVHVDTWVMSCRAFSRRIEHACLRELLERTGATRVELDYVATDRNSVVAAFVADVSGGVASREPISYAALVDRLPRTYARIDARHEPVERHSARAAVEESRVGDGR
jgi:FkbH-like protein